MVKNNLYEAKDCIISDQVTAVLHLSDAVNMREGNAEKVVPRPA